MKVATTPAVLKTLRDYGEGFGAARPAILAHFPREESDAAALFPFAADTDRGLGILLLAAALHRPGASRGDAGWGAEAAAFITGLFETYGTDIFKLNRVPYGPLRDRVAELAASLGGVMEPADRARVPGILRSVCDFFYRVGPLTTWLSDAPDWEQRVGELSQEIYWMGARSRTRTKARLFFWIACSIPGFGARPGMRAQALRFLWPVGDGHMRLLFDIVKPARGTRLGGVEGRQELFADLARQVFPDEPWRLYLPLDAYLKPDGAGGYHCRAARGGCRPCPLAPLCPAAKHFLVTERQEGL